MSGSNSRLRRNGFTLLEIVIALAILSIIVTMATPVVQLQLQRQKEAELRAALREMRSALDAYKRATDEGRVARSADSSGYPPRLDVLVEGVKDARDPTERMIYFLRRIPRDPMHADAAVSPSETWATRSYASPPSAPAAGDDVFDVASMSERKGINGIPYREW